MLGATEGPTTDPGGSATPGSTPGGADPGDAPGVGEPV